jgi:hypothetical protein
LEYAHRNGCPWDPLTTFFAASYGNLKCLEYAHRNGCPWHPNTTWGAARYGHIDCLEYIFEYCGDIASWEESDLMNHAYDFPKECKEFIENVKEEWKQGNVQTKNIKG